MKSTTHSKKQFLKLACVLLFIGFYSLPSMGQPLPANYYYDATGNRIKRKLSLVPRENNDPKDSVAIVKNGINVYPNPANDNVNVAVRSASQTKKAVATLLDNTGRILLVKEVNSSDAFQFDLSKYNPGIYLIQVLIDKERLSYQVIKGD